MTRKKSGIHMLEVTADMMGRTVTIHPTVLWDEDDLVLVDTAYPGQLPLLTSEVSRAGLSFDRLSKVIITHQDLDHIGGLPAIEERFAARVEVMASPLEKPFIEGEQQLLKLTPAAIAEAVSSLPANVPEQWRLGFKHTLENPPRAAVHSILTDKQRLPICGGMIVIGTPGHTPGHISLYHEPSRTLIAGDALIAEEGQLYGPDPQYCIDYELAQQSLAILLDYDIQQVICFHGGRFEGDGRHRIAELLRQKR
ncbi:hydrolase [Paenibacillus dendritiformis]|uniref:MBL fold metallo-hydrolase n=1 Tax=Paenibacillus dendritiformis TaxID=130049 RepID=UPI001F554D8B|nr:MBL fold metallo-hydrolase [Paenibacillus dendritiformis]MBG9796129.1 hydrolase [Paenibacillus dendritiformis]